MGWGDFGSNGSVHWTVGYEDKNPKNVPDHADFDDQVKHPGKAGIDPRPPIGGSGGRNHTGSFRVTLRFKNNADLKAALAALTASAGAGGNDMVIDVPARPYA